MRGGVNLSYKKHTTEGFRIHHYNTKSNITTTPELTSPTRRTRERPE